MITLRRYVNLLSHNCSCQRCNFIQERVSIRVPKVWSNSKLA